MGDSHEHVEQKKPETKRILTLWSYLYQVEKQVKLTFAIRNQDSGYCGQEIERLKGASGQLGLFSYLDLGAIYRVCSV